MCFTQEYVQKCCNRAAMWRSRNPRGGDVIVHLKDGIRIVQIGEEDGIDYSDPDVVFVPDADALLSMIEGAIKNAGLDPKTAEITLAFSPSDKWHCRVCWGPALTESTRHESAHEALTQVMLHMHGYLAAACQRS